jgi:hypothetical protein
MTVTSSCSSKDGLYAQASGAKCERIEPALRTNAVEPAYEVQPQSSPFSLQSNSESSYQSPEDSDQLSREFGA